MKKIYLFIGLTLSMLAGGCSKDDSNDQPVVPGGEDDVTVQVTATIAEEGLLWSEGATLAINGVESSALAAGGEAAATFEVKNVSAPLKVVAPFKAYDAGDIVTIPDTQKYVAGGYDAEAFVMYGYAEKLVETGESDEDKVVTAEVEMHAACGIVKLPVVLAEGSAVINSISLTAADEEAVAGSWKFDFTKGSATVETAFSTVALDCGETGVALGASAVDFSFVIPAAAYAKGVIIEAGTTDGHKFVCDYTDALTVVAGAETALETMNFEIVEKADATLNITIAEPGIKWAAGDEVVVNGVLSSALAAENAGESTASFDLKSVAYPYTVLYPRELYTTSGRLRFYDEQRLLKNEFDREALAMVGYSFDSEVTLHNVCGLIKIPITNNYENDVVTLQKVCLTSNDGSPLAGKYNINYRNATLSLVSAVDTMTLVPEEGSNGLVIPVGETVYVYAVIPEGRFPQGLTLDVYTDVSNQTGIACTPAGGLNVTRGVETELETVEYTDVKIEAVTTADEFAALVSAINKGRTDRFKNAAGEIVLANDIDLAGVALEQITGLDGAGFVDVFNGQGFALKNIEAPATLISASSGTIKNVVLEGCTLPNFVGTNSGAIDNVTVRTCALSSSLINTNSGTVGNVSVESCALGGSLINSNAAESTVSNVILDASTTVSFDAPTAAANIGFVVGTNAGTVEKCTSSVVYTETIKSLPAAACNFGGVVGLSTGLVTDCEFTGKFEMRVEAPTSSQRHAFGGVVGRINGKSDVIMVQNCKNSGSVIMNYVTAVYVYTGGVVGGTPSAKNAPGNYGIVDNCENTGNVGMIYDNGGSGAYPNLGGVCGYIEGYIQNCTNRGEVSIELKHATNTWTSVKQGGVAGVVTRGADNCHNYGTLTVVSGQFAGGTAGANGAGNSSWACWAGVIAAAGPVTSSNDVVFKNCTNNTEINLTLGTITGTPQFAVGGVFGTLTGSAENCVNNRNVSLATACFIPRAGGVAAATNCNMTDCSNVGNIKVDDTGVYSAGDVNNKRHQTLIGGISGTGCTNGSAFTLTNCSNSGSIELVGGMEESTNPTYIGGVYGGDAYNIANTVTLTDCTNSGSITAPAFDNVHKGNLKGADNDL